MIKSNFPLDNTFLSLIVNESLLNFIGNINCKLKFDGNSVEVKFSESLKETFIKVYLSINKEISIGMVRNDRYFIRDFKKYFGVDDLNIRQTFHDLLAKVKENVNRFNFQQEDIHLSLEIKGDLVLFEPNKNASITAPQIYKIDRFTGYTSAETTFTTKQLKLKYSGETALLCLLGLISSHVLSKREGDNWCYYFLFFSPEEILKLYLEQNRNLIRKYFFVKDKAIEVLRDAYKVMTSSEIILLELALNLKIQELLSKYNFDKISFILFKVAREGQDSYKIYEQIPVIIYRKITFIEIVKKYFKNSEEFIKRLIELFENKRSRLWMALQNKDQSTQYPEGDNIFKAIMGLYRFIILGDLQGYYQFTREIFNCYRIHENSNKTIANYYKHILDRLKVY